VFKKLVIGQFKIWKICSSVGLIQEQYLIRLVVYTAFALVQARMQDFSQGGLFFAPPLTVCYPPPWNCFVQKVN